MGDDAIRYPAMALQTRCETVNKMDIDGARKAMHATIRRVDGQIAAAKVLTGPRLKLVLLPEYFMTGYPTGDAIDAWARKAAIAEDGFEYELLGEVAQKHGIFLAGNAYETDKNFPGLYFQTCFVIEPSGNLILRYRRLISMFAPTPHDVWDRYLELYGLDAVFPVADTEIGRLACCASEEILFPEICRAHALRGAEVILHPTSEIASPLLTPKEIARRARAVENLAYVISANSGGIVGNDMPSASVDGMSKIVDYKGIVLAAADTGESMNANAEIDITALRACRRRPGMPNYLVRQRLELFASAYADGSVYPANTLLNDAGEPFVPERTHFIETQLASVNRLIKDELI